MSSKQEELGMGGLPKFNPGSKKERRCFHGDPVKHFGSRGSGLVLGQMREEHSFVHVWGEAYGSNISQLQTVIMENSLYLNRTDALGQQDDEISTALFEFKVFNIVITVLALCILAVTGVYCIAVCYNRTRQSKRAHVYESAVTQGEPVHPVSVKAVKRSTSFINPLAFLRKSERVKDNSRIYYIYSNPLPIGLKEDEEKEVAAKVNWDPEEKTPSFEEFSRNPNSGLILDPPIFYMQL